VPILQPRHLPLLRARPSVAGHSPKPDQALYLTADDVNLSGVRLVDVADEFVARHAGKTLVIKRPLPSNAS
jgi:hypothetical protein